MKLKVKDLISEQCLEELTSQLLDLYDLSEQATSSPFDDNYTFSCCLYRQSFNAIKQHFKKSNLFEELSENNRAILKVVGKPLYLRFLTNNPLEYRKKKGNDILKMFNIFDNSSSNLDLFDNDYKEECYFGFFFYDKSPDDMPYVKLQIFDQFWNLEDEWSSDNIQGSISLIFDESAKDLPEAKPLISGSDQLIPIKPVIPDIKKDS